MKRNEMVKSKKDFTKIIKTGKYIKNSHLIIYYYPKEISKPLFGIAVSKKLGNAVVRNKLKRQARVLIDQNRLLFQNNHDYIIMIREACTKDTFINVNSKFIDLLKGITK